MPTPLSGDPVNASDIVVPRYIVKASSETVNNSSTLQNDNDLFCALPVGVWRIEAIIHYTTPTAADLRTAWTTTGTITSLGRTIIGPSQGMSDVTDHTVRHQGLAIGTASDVGGNTSSANAMREDMMVEVTVTGTLQFQWAQRVATVGDTTLTTASRLFITEVEAFS